LRSASLGSANSSNSLSLKPPNGLTANDVMIAQVVARNVNGGAAVILTAPAGWTLVRSDASSDGVNLQAIYEKVATTSEPASYTWTANVASAYAGGITDFYNVSTSAPIDTTSGQYNATATTSDTAPSVTTNHTHDGLLCFMGTFVGEGTANWILPAGMTKRWVLEGSSALDDAAYALQLLSTSGATGSRTATFPTASTSVGALIALAPAGG
jgi:hypothetical protein